MPKTNKPLSILVDTSYLITLYGETRDNYRVACKYHQYFLENRFTIFLSTIVVMEFHLKQSVEDITVSGHYRVLPYNYDSAKQTAEIVSHLVNIPKNEVRTDRDDFKLIGQAYANNIQFIITEDKSTLTRYCKKLRERHPKDSYPIPILLEAGFDKSHFNNGQRSFME